MYQLIGCMTDTHISISVQIAVLIITDYPYVLLVAYPIFNNLLLTIKPISNSYLLFRNCVNILLTQLMFTN